MLDIDAYSAGAYQFHQSCTKQSKAVTNWCRL